MLSGAQVRTENCLSYLVVPLQAPETASDSVFAAVWVASRRATVSLYQECAERLTLLMTGRTQLLLVLETGFHRAMDVLKSWPCCVTPQVLGLQVNAILPSC